MTDERYHAMEAVCLAAVELCRARDAAAQSEGGQAYFDATAVLSAKTRTLRRMTEEYLAIVKTKEEEHE